METIEEDISKLSTEVKCSHKNWKVRCIGYEELSKLFGQLPDSKSPEWSKYSTLIRKCPCDGNAAAQEKGLGVTLQYLENASLVNSQRLVTDIMEGVVSKCILALKNKSKILATDIALMCVEIEKSDLVQEELMKGLEHKNPKVVTGCITILNNCLTQFGPKVLNTKVILKRMLALAEDRDKVVREESKRLIVEMYRWLGPSFKLQLSAMKAATLQEVEAETLRLAAERVVASRFIRSEQARMESRSERTLNESESLQEGLDESINDQNDLQEPFDILSKLPNGFYEKCDEKKWQERKEVLEKLEDLLTTNPKLIAGDYSDLVRKMKLILVKDAHIAVSMLSAKILWKLATGLGKKFSPYSAVCLTSIFEKFKEKKANFVAALRSASDACFVSITLDVIQEDVLKALQNKNPSIKLETSLFVGRCFLKTPLKILGDKKLMKPFFASLITNVNGSDPGVRDAAAESLAIAKKLLGEKAVSPFLKDLDSIKFQKVNELCEKLDIEIPTVRAPMAKKPIETVSAKNLSAAKNVLPKDSNAILKENTTETDSSNSSNDRKESEDISSLITTAIMKELSDKDWNTRDEAVRKISKIISQHKSIQPKLGDLPMAIAERLQDFNRSVATSAILLCQQLCIALGSSCKKYSVILLPNIIAGLSDNKANNRSTVIACMDAWFENGGICEFFQGSTLYESLKSGNPQLKADLFSWLALKLDNVKNVNKEDLLMCVPLLYDCLEGKAPEVRKSAQDALFPFLDFLGYDTMLRCTDKLKPSSKSTIKTYLDKERLNLKSTGEEVSQSPRKTASAGNGINSKGKRLSSVRAVDTTSDNSGIIAGLLPVNNLKSQRFADESKQKLLRWNFTSPREEFNVLLKDLMNGAGINPNLVTNMFHPDFKYHLKALESLLDDLTSKGHEGALSNLDLILKWIAIRFFDTNPSVLVKSLEYLQILLKQLGESSYHLAEVEVYSFVPYLIIKAGDFKDNIRTNVHNILRQISAMYSPTKICNYILEGVKSKNARQRAECLEEIAYMIQKFGMKVCFQNNVAGAVKGIAKWISDRDTAVRNASLNTLMQVFFHEKDKLYKMVGQLNPKDLSLLEERIKRAGKPKLPERITSATNGEERSTAISPSPKSAPAVMSNSSVVLSSSSPKAKEILQDPLFDINMMEDSKFNNNYNEDNTFNTVDVALPPPLQSDMEIGSEQNVLSGRTVGSGEENPFSIDFSEIDNMFGPEDNEPMPELKLRDTNIDDILNTVIPELPRMRETLATNGQSSQNPEIIQTPCGLDYTISRIGNSELNIAVESLLKLDVLLANPQYFHKLSLKIDYILSMATSQFRQMHTTLGCMSTRITGDVNNYFVCSLNTLRAIYRSAQLANAIPKETTKEFLYYLLVLITDPNLIVLADYNRIVKEINILVIRVIENSERSVVTCASIRLLNETLLYANSINSRLVSLVLKCMWRVVKEMCVWTKGSENYAWDVESILTELNLFMANHPLESFTSRNDLPLRTIKTLIHSLVKTVGVHKVSKQLRRMPEVQESVTGVYIDKVITHRKVLESKIGRTTSGNYDIIDVNLGRSNSQLNAQDLKQIFVYQADSENTNNNG